VLVRAKGVERYLRYFVALGAGFLMATAVMEMIPEGCARVRGWGRSSSWPAIAWCICWSTPSTPISTMARRRTTASLFRGTGNSVLAGLSVHALFDGVAIGSGFALSNWLGWLIFLAIFLHKAPEGFTMASVMLASGRSRAAAFYSAVALAAATLAGVLVIGLAPSLVLYGLPISAGVALYVAATDLVPEVNREPGIRMALVFFAGVGGFLLLRMLLPGAVRGPRLSLAAANPNLSQ
jgi:zinc transporter ZupT